MKQFIYRCLAVCWLTLCLTPPAFAALAHRYSFTEDVSDSIGTAHGALMGKASITNGEVVLPGTAGAYVELPGGIITGFESVTIECWAKFNVSGNWARLYDFGDKNGANGRNYILLSPHSGSADTRMSISDADPGSSNERFVILPGALDNKPLLHVTAVYDPANGFAGLYTNGVLAASRDDLDIPLSSVKNVYSYIGRSLYSSDAYLNARITEFRIYDQALSASDIALSFQLGTNTPANHGPATIATQPQDKAVNELQPVTLTVSALGTAPRALQWYKNDAPIAGATNANYTLDAAPASDNGARFKVIVGNTFSNVAYSVTSSSAVLTVNPDMTPPTLLRAANFSPTQVDVAFSEAIRPDTATDLRHYVLTSTSGPVAISGAVLNPDQSSVLLTTAPLTAGTLYTLTVNGVRDVSSAANAIAADAQATFTAQAYTIVDIGNPIPGGTATAAGGGYDVVAGGRDILGASDQFSLLSIQRTGDFDVKVQVPGLSLSDAFAKAGLMARELTNSNSRYAATFATPSVAGTFFQARLATAGATTNMGSLPVSYPDTWLRLRRAANVFSGYAGFDGNRWTLLGSATIAMSNTVYFGMAVSSRNTNQTTTAQFRNLENVTDATVGQIALTGEPLGPSSRKTGLAISEIMYHPRTVPGSTRSLEFVEVFNSQAFWEDIGGYRLTGSIDYTFPAKTVIPAGGFLVVARDPEFVQSHYGIVGVLGPWAGASTNGLPGGQGTVRLRERHRAVLLEVNYRGKNPWPIAADGAGHSLVLARASYGEDDPRAWAASDRIDGSPGGPEPLAGADPLMPVVINEFLAHTASPLEDYIELYNHSGREVDLSGAYLTDEGDTNKFRISNGTKLPAGGFLAFYQSTLGFSLSASGERIYLVNSNQTRVIDAVEYEPQASGISSGRVPDGAPAFYPLAAQTPAAANGDARPSDIVINEIMYSPISGANDDEFIELYNRGSRAVNVGKWKFTSGVSFTLPDNMVIAPDGYLVVAKNATRLRSNYANLTAANTVGNYSGTLANGGERLALAVPEPDVVVSNGVAMTNTIYVVVNEVTYGDGGRWSLWAHGNGSSLELKDPRSDNRQAANWTDSDESMKAANLWTNIEYTGPLGETLSQGTINDNLHVYLLGVGECLVDDIEVHNGAGPNTITNNASFEDGLTGWTPQGSHDFSTIETNMPAYSGRGSLHLRAGSRGDGSVNKIRSSVLRPTASGVVTLRAKARWVRGFPELLLRLHGGGAEVAGRLPIPTNLGSPGARNSRAVPNAGPAIYDVIHSPILPVASEPVVVTARATDPDGLASLQLKYRDDPSGPLQTAAMVDDGTGGDAISGDGLYSATIPGRPGGTLVAFYLIAIDNAAARATNIFPQDLFPPAGLPRVFPSDSPSRELLVRWGEVQPFGSFGAYHLWITAATQARWSARPDDATINATATVGRDRMNNTPLDGTFVYNNSRVIYNMRPQFAGSSWHQDQFDGPTQGDRVDFAVEFPEDNQLLGAGDFVWNNPGNPGGSDTTDGSAQSEQTSYIIFKEIGVHYNHRRYIHVFVNGNRRSTVSSIPGNFVMEDSQQANSDVVSEWFPDDTAGSLFKIEDWFEWNDSGRSHANNDADLERRTITYNGVTSLNLAPYRFMWRRRSLSPWESASDYSDIFAMVDAISPAASPTINPLPATVVANFGSLVNIDQWMRIFAVQHAIGNWDSYGYDRGKNCYAYRPSNGGGFELMTWDIDFTMNIGGNDASTPVFGANDPRVAAMYNTPSIRRMYLRAFQDILNGPWNRAYLDPILNAKAAALAANGIAYSSGQLETIKTFVSARRTTLLGLLSGQTNAFRVTTPPDLATNDNFITLTGYAPVQVATMKVNGQDYPVSWTSVSNWAMRFAVSPGANEFIIQGYDRLGNALDSARRTNVVTYTGSTVPPQNALVFNEIMYNPTVPEASYVELFNTATNFAFNLSGWSINGLSFTFPEGTVIGSRQFLVVAKNALKFSSTYGPGIPVAGQFDGNLDLDGETLTLIQPGATPAEDVTVDKVKYESAEPWSRAANGTGAALQLVDAAQDNSRVSNWSGSEEQVWRFLSYTNSASGSRLVFNLDTAGGDVYVDDVALVAGSVPEAGDNLIYNPGFEGLLDPNWIVTGLATNSVITSSVAHSGNNSLHLIFNAGTSTLTNFYQDAMPIVTNATYTLSFWYLAGGKGTNLTARLSSTYKPSVNYRRAVATPGAQNYFTATYPPYPLVWLNEAQAENLSGIRDAAGEREPWIELYNSSSSPINLEGYYLANNYSNLTQWAFPAGASINPGEFKVLFADDEPGESTAAEWHTSFRLNSSTGSVALVRIVERRPQIVDYLNYHGLRADESYGSYPDGQLFQRQIFNKVTPRAPNNATAPPAKVFINEWMAANVNPGGYPDPATGENDDWFELYNAGTEAVNLAGYFLTDNLGNTTQYRIPTGYSIPAKGFLVAWADNQTDQNDPSRADLHVNFQLSKSGEQIGLFAPDGTAIDTIRFDAQTNNVSQGRWPDGAAALYFMPEPTPRTANSIPGLPNTRPVLQPIGNRLLPELSLLSFKALALDADQPPQRLVYSLATGAPAGASITADGQFRWRPLENQGPGVYTLTVRVTDDGKPPLSAEQSFQVAVEEVNSSPYFVDTRPKYVNAGSLLTFLTAVDGDLPPQTLAFTLGAGAQAGMSLHPVTGLFSWTPADSLAPGRYFANVLATDNGRPPMSASYTYTIEVKDKADTLIVVTAARTGANVQLTWPATPGKTYQLLYKESLAQPNWKIRADNLQTLTSTLTFTDTPPGTRFYKVRQVD